MLQVVTTLVTVGLLVYALIDSITCDSWRVRHLPKLAWVLIIFLLPIFGPLLWIFLGKERDTSSAARRRVEHPPVVLMDDDVAIENEIAFYENQARIRRLEAELRARREGESGSNG